MRHTRKKGLGKKRNGNRLSGTSKQEPTMEVSGGGKKRKGLGAYLKGEKKEKSQEKSRQQEP